jgi:hypothetical protein
MTETERYAALMTTLSTIVVELGDIKEAMGPRNEPTQTQQLSHSAQVISFVYSPDLRVSKICQL